MIKTVITNNFSETQQLGSKLSQNLQNAQIIALYGDLGSGKTTFVQGFAQGLGIKKKIISPTFIIVRTYEIDFGRKDLRFKNFYHIDLYRIKDEHDIEGLGLSEIMSDPENIVAIEWPEKIENLLPDKRISISFEYLDSNGRRISIAR